MRSEPRFEKPELSRVSFSDSSGEAVFNIPPRRNLLVMAFMAFWLCGWTVGGVTAITTFIVESGGKPLAAQAFLAFWLCGWAVGWIFVASQLLWGVHGTEVLAASGNALSHSYRILSWSRTKSYAPTSIENLRWVEGALGGVMGRGYGNNPMSSVSFEYGAKTISVARGTDAGEGKFVVAGLQRRLGLRAGHSYEA